MESYVYKIIPVSGISTEFLFAARYSFEDRVLADSIKRRGVLKPMVFHGSQIVSGHKRFLAAKAAGLKEIPAFEISGSPAPADLYVLGIFSNWNQAQNDLDRAWAVWRALSDFKIDEETVQEEILPALGLEPQKHFLEEYRETASLAPAVLQSIRSAHLPFRGARILARFSKPEQEMFAKSIVAHAALTTNQLIKAGEWLFDLMKLKGDSMGALLKSSGLEALLGEPGHDRRQKGERFCAHLRALRFPELVRKEKEFEALAGKIETDQGVSLEAPPSFEGEGLTLRAKLSNPAALDRLAAVLEQKRKLFNSLFDIML